MHKGNALGSLSFTRSIKVKKEYSVISLVMEKIKYIEHKWVICVDLKMVNFYRNQQGVYTKHSYFIGLAIDE